MCILYIYIHKLYTTYHHQLFVSCLISCDCWVTLQRGKMGMITGIRIYATRVGGGIRKTHVYIYIYMIILINIPPDIFLI